MLKDNLNERLLYDGTKLSDEDLRLLERSIMNSLKMAKIINKQKYTPKKYIK